MKIENNVDVVNYENTDNLIKQCLKQIKNDLNQLRSVNKRLGKKVIKRATLYDSEVLNLKQDYITATERAKFTYDELNERVSCLDLNTKQEQLIEARLDEYLNEKAKLEKDMFGLERFYELNMTFSILDLHLGGLIKKRVPVNEFEVTYTNLMPVLQLMPEFDYNLALSTEEINNRK